MAEIGSSQTIDIGVVVIGRNEGERLRRCLESLRLSSCAVVYVDSGSIDGSIDLARSSGAEVVSLDMSAPFTAARARNAGFHRLTELRPDLEVVQFMDGDCEVIASWLETARTFLRQHGNVACVCGRLREQFPERSVYNRLCEVEWDRPAGETDACGGIAMMRCALFAQAKGFREDLLAGEEPELCARLRASGFKIWRLAEHMAWHDAAMLRFGQWWMRSKRTGFGYAQNVWLSAGSGERLQVRRAVSSWIWAGVVPLGVVAGYVMLGWPACLLLLAYPVQVLRVAAKVTGSYRLRMERAFFMVLGRFPELLGQVQFLRVRHSGRRSRPSFDYKS